MSKTGNMGGKRGRGRPPKGPKAMQVPITIRFPEPMMREIEAIQASRLDQPEKGQVVRELVARGLETMRASGATGPAASLGPARAAQAAKSRKSRAAHPIKAA